MLLAVLAIVLMVFLVIGIHEMGHALAAYFFQVRIKRISIGFGKPLISFRAGCEWVIALIPLGGYVQLLNTRIAPVDEADYPWCFDKKPIAVRIIILLSGAFANLITAWLALILVFSMGLTEKLPLIGAITPHSIAAKAGLLPGDRIIAVSGHKTDSWREIGMHFLVAIGQESIPVIVRNQATSRTAHMNLRKDFYVDKKKSLLTNMGIQPLITAPKVKFPAQSALQAMGQANQYIFDTIRFMVLVLKQLLTGMLSFSMLLGPIGLFTLTISSLSYGLIVFLFFIAGFSIAVAFINLMPIPTLDGGSILYAVIEKIRGKPISVALEVLLHELAVIAFVVLLVNLLVNDLLRF